MIVLLWAVFAVPFAAVSAMTAFRADERFELTSIAARLAGYGEYGQSPLYGYSADIDEYFAPFKEHALIKHLQSIRRSRRIGYDAIPTATRTLVIVDGGVMLDPRADVARLCETDDRWTEEDLYEFVALADDFYRDTDFHAFFEDHAGLYAAGEELVNSFAEVDRIRQ